MTVENEFDLGKWFYNKPALLTGATGFMGKVLVEKLLRDTEIPKIYILLRAKTLEDFKKRFEDYKNNEVFTRIQNKQPDLLLKLHPIYGDVTKNDLGLDAEDRNLLCRQVEVVFHCAASVRFDDSLKKAVILNTKGTVEMLKLATDCRNLKAFIHVSTAYSNTDKKHIEERVYNPLKNYKHVINSCLNDDNDTLKKLEQEVLQIFPNTYVFSKNLAESVVNNSKDILPAAIIRPSVVCPSYAEPFPGWVDSFNGPMGVLVGASSGILRTVRGHGGLNTDLIPVDHAINATIALAARIGESGRKDIPVYNCTTSSEAPITWNQFLELGREIYMQYPSTKVLWYPGGSMHVSKLVHIFCFIFFQLLPAVIVDSALFCIGKKPWLTKLQRKIFYALQIFECFLSNEWKWRNDNLKILYQQLSIKDKYIFNFDANKINYREYVENWVLGARRFILKLDDDTIPWAKTKLKILYWVDLVAKFILVAILFYLSRRIFNSFVNFFNIDCFSCKAYSLKIK